MGLEMKQTLSMKLTQRLMMTPMLQQSIKLLQLSKLELTQLVHQELQENPMLEEVQSEVQERSSEEESHDWEKDSIRPEDIKLSDAEQLYSASANEDFDWEGFLNDSGDTGYYSEPEEREVPPLENILTRPQTLQNYLLWQLRMSSVEEQEFWVGEFIIGNIDENGYLRESLDEIAQELSVPQELVEKILAKVQTFDPVGVGARDPQECLLLQITEEKPERRALLERIVRDHLHHLELKEYPAIAKDLGITIDNVIDLAKIILSYDPKPGRKFDPEGSFYIVPDVFVYKVDDEYVLTLNDEGLPQLRVSNAYKRILRNGHKAPDQTRKYVEEKLRSAVWLIKSIQQRQRTLYNVASSIVRFQREFLDKGLAYLRPLTLMDVANDVSMHESTISRVTTNKYIYTPRGIFELKFFFNPGFKRAQGDYISSVRVKELIKEMIKNEDGRKPLSDKQILQMLKQRGINIARRTIAKYRDELNILPSQRRKVLYPRRS
ncbi:MAG: RNA polymerase factor sigma-54 [bacterium]